LEGHRVFARAQSSQQGAVCSQSSPFTRVPSAGLGNPGACFRFAVGHLGPISGHMHALDRVLCRLSCGVVWIRLFAPCLPSYLMYILIEVVSV
jgi:hypothetical protein